MKELTETDHWEFFSQAFFCCAGLRPHGAVKLTGCDIKKGSKGLFSQFQPLHLPHYTMYQLTADARDVLPHLR